MNKDLPTPTTPVLDLANRLSEEEMDCRRMSWLTADHDGDTCHASGDFIDYKQALLNEYFAIEGIKRKAKHHAKLKKYLARLM